MPLSNHPLGIYPSYAKFYTGNVLLSAAARSVALIFCWWVASSYEESGFRLGVLMSVQALPYLGLSCFYGPLIDRYDKKRVILVGALAQLLLAVAMAAIFVTHSESYLWVCILLFAQSCCMPLVDDSCNALVPYLVENIHLPAASATQASMFEMSNIIAALTSTLFMSYYGITGALIVNAGLYLAGFLFVLSIQVATKTTAGNNRSLSFIQELRAGFRMIYRDRALFAALCLCVGYIFILNQTFVLIPLLVADYLHADVSLVGAIEIGLSIAVVLISFIISTRKQFNNLYPTFALTALLSAGLFLAISLTTAGWIYILVFTLLGACVACFWSLMHVVFQMTVANEFKGRFFSILSTLAFGTAPLSYLAVGFISDYASVSGVLYLDVVALLLVGIAALYVPRCQLFKQ